MSQNIDMYTSFATYMALLGIIVAFGVLLPAILINSFLFKKWVTYAKKIHVPNFTGNSLDLLREVCSVHHLEVKDVFCFNQYGQFVPVTEHRSGDIFYQFALYNSKKVTLGEIYNDCICIHSQGSWYQQSLIRHRLNMAINNTVDFHLSTP